MRYFDRYAEERFRELPDGRRVFYPRGPDGPAYLVPDEATQKGLERLTRVAAGVNFLALLVLGFALRRAGEWWHWAAPLIAVPVVNWYVDRLAAERLQPIDGSAVAAGVVIQADEGGTLASWGIVGGAALLAGVSVAVVVQHPAAWARWTAIAVAFACALVIAIALQDVQRRRDLERQRERIMS